MCVFIVRAGRSGRIQTYRSDGHFAKGHHPSAVSVVQIMLESAQYVCVCVCICIYMFVYVLFFWCLRLEADTQWMKSFGASWQNNQDYRGWCFGWFIFPLSFFSKNVASLCSIFGLLPVCVCVCACTSGQMGKPSVSHAQMRDLDSDAYTLIYIYIYTYIDIDIYRYIDIDIDIYSRRNLVSGPFTFLEWTSQVLMSFIYTQF